MKMDMTMLMYFKAIIISGHMGTVQSACYQNRAWKAKPLLWPLVLEWHAD